MRRLLLFSLISTALFAESHPSWWALASPDATALVGIRWESVRQSPFAAALGAELSTTGSLGFPDLPVLKDARQILFSSPDLLAIASGEFPTATLREQAAAKGWKQASYRGVELWLSPGKTTLSVAQLSEQLVIAGLHKTLEAAIDRNLADSRSYSPLLSRAAHFSQSDLWVVATQLPDALASLFIPIEADARGFEGGVALHDGLSLGASLDAESQDAAATIAETVRRSIPDLPAVAQGLQVTVESHSVRLALEVKKDDFAAGLRQSETPKPTPPPPATEVAVTPPAMPKEPAAPQVIRIFGLDDGPREIILAPAKPEKP